VTRSLASDESAQDGNSDEGAERGEGMGREDRQDVERLADADDQRAGDSGQNRFGPPVR
jgi:hypothetical protein